MKNRMIVIMIVIMCLMQTLVFSQTETLYTDTLGSFICKRDSSVNRKLLYKFGDSLELVVGVIEGGIIEGLFYKDSTICYLEQIDNGGYDLRNRFRPVSKSIVWPSCGSFVLCSINGQILSYLPQKRTVSEVKLLAFNTLTWVETIWTETDEVESKYKITALVNFGPKEAQRRKKLIMANRGVSGEPRRQLLIDLHEGNFKVLERVAVE